MGIFSFSIGLLILIFSSFIAIIEENIDQHISTGFICGSLFFIGGMILIKINEINENIKKNKEKNNDENGKEIKINKFLWEK